ncbi:MAG: adenylate/guanylate cyclase domain-containing protein [Roseibium sp.]|nr:adenylate/guanylate cyclase domain-containing protein [Roseibium sp.]
MKRFLVNVGSRIGIARLAALACLAAFLALRVIDPVIVEFTRLKTFDFYQYLSPREPAPLPVAIVDIDEKSLQALGQWPWPRSSLAQMLGNIGRAGGIAVAFDMVFAERDRLSPQEFIKSVPDLDPKTRDDLARLPNNDAILANVMRQMRVVVGQAGRVDTGPDGRADQAQTPVALLGPDPQPFLLEYPKILRNIDVLEDASAGRGLFSIYPDWDSIVRRAALVAVADDKIQPSLSVELLRVATGQNAFAIKSDDAGIKSVVVGGVEVPTDRNGRIWVHYTPHDPTRFVSAIDVLDGSFDPAAIQNHLVLVGTSATGLLDLKATPLDPAMPGVEVHAQILETILGQSYLKRPNYAIGAELVIAAALSLLIIYFVPILGALPVLLLGLVLSASWVAGSWYLFTEQKILLDAVYPLFASITVFLLLVFVNYRREEVRRQEIRSAFGQYLAPDYVELIAENPDSLKLGGERRRMTVLFSDVRGFTEISESFKDNPQGLTGLMNRFLTPLSEAITEKRGTIDKYMGDAIMAFWNAPLDDDQPELRACHAALGMIARMNALNSIRQTEAEAAGETYWPLNVGIGINSGDCVVGNMGSEFRFDYSVLGDAVNLASRLEGQSKTYGVTVILGENTAREVADQLAVVEIDLIRVKGKQEPERIYCLIGDETVAAGAGFQKDKVSFETMLEAYRTQAWADAGTQLAELEHSDFDAFRRLAKLFRQRVEDFQISPPPGDWDGVYVAQTK